ncbi:hypothetical protein RSAG8_10562, partial [Rhizoctonia solani AG-8 WAC10335]
MSETNSAPPSDAGRDSNPRRGRGRYRGAYRGNARPMRKYSRPPASETQTESPTPSTLELETNEPAPTASTPSKTPLNLALPPKPVEAIESLKNHRGEPHVRLDSNPYALGAQL